MCSTTRRRSSNFSSRLKANHRSHRRISPRRRITTQCWTRRRGRRRRTTRTWTYLRALGDCRSIFKLLQVSTSRQCNPHRYMGRVQLSRHRWWRRDRPQGPKRARPCASCDRNSSGHQLFRRRAAWTLLAARRRTTVQGPMDMPICSTK